MANGRIWALKGVSDRTRDAAVEAAHSEGLKVGDWVDRVLARAAEEASHPKPPAATRDDVAEVVREQLAPVIERLAALEGKVGRPGKPEELTGGGPGTAADQAGGRRPGPRRGAERGPPGQAPGRRRGLPEEVRARIEELHRAGRSAYAISKELGVSYNTVRAHVRAR